MTDAVGLVGGTKANLAPSAFRRFYLQRGSVNPCREGVAVSVVLANGALQLARHDGPRFGVVLARIADSEHEYATWEIRPDGLTYWGHYFFTLAEAKADFAARAEAIDSA